MIKLKLIKELLTSAAKPLPLSGIVREVKELKQSKFEKEKVLKLVVYLIGGSIVWAVIFGKIDLDTAKQLLVLIGI